MLVAASLPAIASAQAGPCADPWINTAFHQIYGRAPAGSGKNVGECDITRYGNGHWSSYQDLTTKIAQHGTGTHAPVVATGSSVLVRPSGSSGTSSLQNSALVANTTHLPANALAGNANGVANGASLIKGAGIVSQGGGNIVAQGGGNIVSQGGGNVISKNGTNLIGQDGNGFRPNGR